MIHLGGVVEGHRKSQRKSKRKKWLNKLRQRVVKDHQIRKREELENSKRQIVMMTAQTAVEDTEGIKRKIRNMEK